MDPPPDPSNQLAHWPSRDRRWLSLLADALALITLALVASKLTSGLERGLDIDVGDEAAYMLRGLSLGSQGMPEASLAPLYAVWYFLLSRLQPNPVALYYLNYRLMTLLPAVVAYLGLRWYRVSVLAGLCVAWYILTSYGNIGILPKVSHFAVTLVLCWLMIAGSESVQRVARLAPVGALVVAYVRPEFFPVSLFFLACSLLPFLTGAREHRPPGWAALISYTLFVALLLIVGVPTSGNRSLIAFGQHFSLNWVAWTNSTIDPWTNWIDIFTANFGSAQSIWAALRANPEMFILHVRSNLAAFLPVARKLVTRAAAPAGTVPEGMVFLAILAVCVLRFSAARRNAVRHRSLVFIVSPFVIVAAITMALIFPRPHYMLVPFVLCVFVTAVLVFAQEPGRSPSAPTAFDATRLQGAATLLALGAALVLITPVFVERAAAAGTDPVEIPLRRWHAFNDPVVDTPAGEEPGTPVPLRPNLATIRFIQSLGIDQPNINILDADHNHYAYLGPNFHTVAEYSKDSSFLAFARERDIGLIILGDRLAHDTRFIDDPEWRSFLLNSQDFGYSPLPIPNTDRILFVRDDLKRK